MSPSDVEAYARALVRCPSVTPASAGSLELIARWLRPLGFDIHHLRFGPAGEEVENLYARLGDAPPVLAFCGHVDVVPAEDAARWRHPPFAAAVEEGILYGRGAADMKGAIAAFLAALEAFLQGGRPRGSLALLLTADEEGAAVHGTRALLHWLEQRGERLDFALVGEPTCERRLGDAVKIGRRGSLTARLRAQGQSGHVAYPDQACNAAHALVRLLGTLIEEPLDAGSEHFAPSTLQIVRLAADGGAVNRVPGAAEAVFNVRFNDRHRAGSLVALLEQRLGRSGCPFTLEVLSSSEPFLTRPGPEVQRLIRAIEDELGSAPVLSTGGGTSDARFLHRHCPVVEFGLVARNIHGVDEQVPLSELEALSRVYLRFLGSFFGDG